LDQSSCEHDWKFGVHYQRRARLCWAQNDNDRHDDNDHHDDNNDNDNNDNNDNDNDDNDRVDKVVGTYSDTDRS